MAFIVIVHLSPEHKSSMAELLQTQTSLEVSQVDEKTDIQADHVYIIPPDRQLTVGDSHLELSDREQDDHRPQVVDDFFRSLGSAKGERAVGVILSGTGSDGAAGLKTVRENGGLTIAQDPGDAQYDDMPQNAINTGCVDEILPVARMAKELTDYKKALSGTSLSDNPETLSEDDEQVLSKILGQIRSETGHDFSDYKRSTILRRIERRMHVTHASSLVGYLTCLNNSKDEVQHIFKDLLISVTDFFRDPETFTFLENNVISKLFEDKHRDDELRVWVPGCATGEEAYSIAMLLVEQAQKIDHPPQLQIFATDIDEEALSKARSGRYPNSITGDINRQRLNRFFHKEGYEYVVSDELKNIILFTKHNLLGSPPFSNLDMISCRNLLIYLNRELQKQVFNLFCYALNDKGRLFLGASDSNIGATELFTSLSKQHRVYRQSSKSRSKVHLPDLPLQYNENQYLRSQSRKIAPKGTADLAKNHRELITRHYGPPSVVINENDEMLHATGNIHLYLKYSEGEPSRRILEIVIPELRQPLRSVLYQAKKDGKTLPVRRRLRLNLDDRLQLIEISVHHIKQADFAEELRCIIFKKVEDPQKQTDGREAVKSKAVSNEDVEIIEELENELKHTKEQLQVTVEDYETTNEELRSSNEELQSMNEELQSTTEELETSQEELESLNEELKTANEELESKIEKLSKANNDLKNLTDITGIGIIFLDRQARVKRFTSKATDIFNLTESDLGRPLEHFTNRLHYDAIFDDIQAVLGSPQKIKKEVSTDDSLFYIMRLIPYETTEGELEGVVITFVEVTELKAAQTELSEKVEQIKKLHRQILKNDVHERYNIGQYLHDKLGQTLTAALMMINHLKGELQQEEIDLPEEVDRLKEIISENLEGVRNLAHKVVPVDVQQDGVFKSFKQLSKKLEKMYDINCRITGNQVLDGIGDIETASHLYRVVGEATKNAVEHGQANNINITLNANDKFLFLTIEDDGKGFDDSSQTDGGMGINIMRHRIELLDGVLEIKNATDDANNGVMISCKVPVNSE